MAEVSLPPPLLLLSLSSLVGMGSSSTTSFNLFLSHSRVVSILTLLVVVCPRYYLDPPPVVVVRGDDIGDWLAAPQGQGLVQQYGAAHEAQQGDQRPEEGEGGN